MKKKTEFAIRIAMIPVFFYYWIQEIFKSYTVYPWRLTKIMYYTLQGKIQSEQEKEQEALLRAERGMLGQED